MIAEPNDSKKSDPTEDNHEKIMALYDAHYKVMYYIAKEILKDDSLAEDAVSTTFIRLIENKDKINLPEVDKARTFLVTVVRNVAIDMRRRQQLIQFTPLEKVVEETVPDNRENVEGVIEYRETVKELEAIIVKLKKKYRDVLYLKVVKGMKDEEICAVLDISRENLRVRLFRAREQIMKEMDKGKLKKAYEKYK